MPSKMSWFNKEIFLQILRSVGWVSIVYFFGLLIALPIRMMMTYSSEQFVNFQVDSLFRYDFHIQIALLVSIPVLMAVFLFRFLHVKQAAVLMHSLPIKRTKIYHHYVLSGIGLLIVPVVFIAILILITHSVLDLSLYFDVKNVLYWAAVTILINIVVFLAGVFVAMMTGISAVQGVLTYIFLIFPVGITLLVFSNLRLFLYGFPGDYLVNKDLEKYSPITYAAMLDNKPLQWNYAIGLIVFAFILYGLSLFFYQKRKIEAAAEAIAFSNLRVIFKYGVTTCVMLFGGVYFSELQDTNLAWIIFGYGLGAIIGYFVAEMVLQKTWRVYGKIKGLIVYSLVVTLLMVSVQLLGFYEKRLPELEEVSSVMLTGHPYIFSDAGEMYQPYFVPSPLKSEKNKKEVLKLHKQILTDKKLNQKLKDGQYETAFLLYTLKDGSQIARQYRINRELYEDSFKSIHESVEYKQAINEIFQLDHDKINNISITNSFSTKRSVSITNLNEITEAIEAIKQDILSESYQDELYFEGRGAGIEIFVGTERSIYLNFKPTYQHFSKWLEENSLLENTNSSADEIDKIVVAEMEIGSYSDQEEVIKQIENNENLLTVTDKSQINHCLTSASSMLNYKYSAVVYYKDGIQKEILSFNDEHAPEFMKKHFNKGH